MRGLTSSVVVPGHHRPAEAAVPGEIRATRSCLVVTTSPRVKPELLEAAIAGAHGRCDHVRVLIPAVLPPALPISALPPRLAVHLTALQRAALTAALRDGAACRVEIVRCRDAKAAVTAAAAADPPGEIVFVGAPGWSLRRAVRGIAPSSVVTDRSGADHGRGSPKAGSVPPLTWSRNAIADDWPAGRMQRGMDS